MGCGRQSRAPRGAVPARWAGATVGEGLFGAPQSFIPGVGCGSMQRAARTLVRFARQTHPAARVARWVQFGGLVPALWSCSGTKVGVPGDLAPPSSALPAGEIPVPGAR